MSSVTETLQSYGSFEIRLKPTTPVRFLAKLTEQLSPNELAGFFTHIIVTRERVDADAIGSASFLFPGADVFPSTELFPLRSGIYEAAAYAGVVRQLPSGDDLAIGGVGMEFWLGDEDGKGAVYETTKSLSSASLSTVLDTLLPASVTKGQVFAVGATFTGDFVFTDPRHALRFALDAMGAEYRVNADASVDAGAPEQLYGAVSIVHPGTDVFPSTTLFPQSQSASAVVVRKNATDPEWATLRATQLAVDADVEDYTTRAIVVASTDVPTLEGSANLEQTTEYRDLFGNALKLTRIISEEAEAQGSAAARARAQLGRFDDIRRNLSLSVGGFAIEGSLGPGFWVNVYDPESGLVDLGNQITFHGVPIWPKKVRVVGVTWPVKRGMGVYHRDRTGVLTDISDWVEWGDGDVSLEIGSLSRSIFDGAA